MKTCKECKEEKEITEFYSHPLTKDWRINRCKECVKAWRRTEKERSMARVNDSKRAKKPERIAKMVRNAKRFRERNPEKYKAQNSVNNFFRKYPELKPNISSVSGETGRIHMHHRDYSKPFDIIPCTAKEHRAFHNGKLEEKDEYVISLKSHELRQHDRGR